MKTKRQTRFVKIAKSEPVSSFRAGDKRKFREAINRQHAQEAVESLFRLELLSKSLLLLQAMSAALPVPKAAPAEPVTCSQCSGSGEGQFDGTTCRVCKGSGEVMADE